MNDIIILSGWMTLALAMAFSAGHATANGMKGWAVAFAAYTGALLIPAAHYAGLLP